MAQDAKLEPAPEPPQDAQETAKTEVEGNTVQEVETAAPGKPGASPVDLGAIRDKKEFMAKVLEIYGWDLDGRKSLKKMKAEVASLAVANRRTE